MLLATLLLFTAERFHGTVRAEETKKAETSVRILVYGNRNNVEFQVRERDGKAVAGASVEIRNGKGEWLFYGTTDGSGRKSLWMPLSTQEYRVYKSGYEKIQGKFKINSLLSKLSVKVVLKKMKTPETKPEPPAKPKPTPKPTPGPKPGPDGNNGGSTGDGGSTPGGTGALRPGTGSSGSEDSNREKEDGEEPRKEEEKNKEKQKPEEKVETGESDESNETDGSSEDAKEGRVKEASQYGERVDLAVNVYKTDGSPAAGVEVELHSDIWTGTLDENGFILFRGVEIGDHVLYVKNGYGKILAQDAFTIRRSNITAMESENVMTVGIAVSKVTLNLEYDEDGEMKFESVWEGLNDRTGRQIEEKGANEARKQSSNAGLRLLGDIRFWISIAAFFLLFLCGYWTGKRRERAQQEKGAKRNGREKKEETEEEDSV